MTLKIELDSLLKNSKSFLNKREEEKSNTLNVLKMQAIVNAKTDAQILWATYIQEFKEFIIYDEILNIFRT